MLVKYLNNGVQQHVENALGRSLITAGLAEEVKKQAVVPEPVWSVVFDPGGYVAIRMEMGVLAPNSIGAKPQAMTVAFYNGDPKFIHDRRDHAGNAFCSAFGRRVPDEVLSEYKKVRKAARPERLAPALPHVPDSEYNRDMAASLERLNQAQRQRAENLPKSEREALIAEGFSPDGQGTGRTTVDGVVLVIPSGNGPTGKFPEKEGE